MKRPHGVYRPRRSWGAKKRRNSLHKRRLQHTPAAPEQLEARWMLSMSPHGYGGPAADRTCEPCQVKQVAQQLINAAGQTLNTLANVGKAALSAVGVHFGTGTTSVKASQQPGASDQGTTFGQSLYWSNTDYEATGSGSGGAVDDGFFGYGMSAGELPQLISQDDGVVLLTDGSFTEQFDPVSGGFAVRSFSHDTLSALDSTNHRYTLTDEGGNVFQFHSFETSVPAKERGALWTMTDAAGNAATATYDSSGYLTKVDLTTTVGSATKTDEYTYTHITSGDNAGLISDVELDRKVTVSGTTTTTVIQSSHYDYYLSTDTQGQAHDMKLAAVKDGSGNIISESYFRWYLTDSSTGYAHAMKYSFSDASFRRLLAATGATLADPSSALSASDTVADDYADDYFEYDSHHRVSKVIAQGTGCSVCDAGLGTYTYAYSTSGNADGFNSWKYKTIETLPDGTCNVVYSNYAGETMLAAHVIDLGVSDEQDWFTFTEYDSTGKPILEASPSAVSSSLTLPVAETYADLLHFTSGGYQYLNDSDGLIYVTDYFTSTTATTNTNTSSSSPFSPSSGSEGGVDGYVNYHGVKHGESGTLALLDSTQYYLVSGGGATIAAVATSTAYSQPTSTVYDSTHNPTGAATTKSEYTFYPSSVWVQQRTDTLPAVSDEGSGVGSSDKDSVIFDIHGRPAFEKTPRNIINYWHYDEVTGALLESIQDLDTSWSGLSGLANAGLRPTGTGGWTTPTGGGLNLQSNFVIDDQGRTVIAIDSANHATLTAIYDTLHEVRIYTGWIYSSGTGGFSNPANYSQDTSSTRPAVGVAFDDLTYHTGSSGSYVGWSYSETASMTQVAKSTTSGSSTAVTLNGVDLPIGGEAIAGVQSLSIDIQNQAGQTIETDDYYAIPTLSSTYIPGSGAASVLAAITSTGAQAGSSASNFYRSQWFYDKEGLLNKEITATGIIYRYVHDSLGRTTSVWIGANNAGGSAADDYVASSPYWQPTPSNHANMIELSAYVYDTNGDGADSNMTEEIDFPAGNGDSAANFRATVNDFDFRGRLVSSKAGALVATQSTDPTGGQIGFHVDGIDDWIVLNPSGEGGSGDTTVRPIFHFVYDNWDDVVEEDLYSGNTRILANVSDSGISGHPTSPADTLLRAEQKHYFDARGREYQTDVYNVGQTNGSAGSVYATGYTFFDADDEVTKLQDPLSNYTTMTYDGVGRLLTQLDPNKSDGSASGGALTSYAYSTSDGHVEVTDPNGKVWKSYFDAAGRLIEADQPQIAALQSGTTDASGSPSTSTKTPKTTYDYGDDGLLSKITDPNGNDAATHYFTSYSHDALGRTTSIARPSASLLSSGALNSYSASSGTPTVGYSYDGDGNVVAYTNENGGVTHFAVDKFDNVIAVAPPGEALSTSTPGKGAIYSYNNLGEQVSVQTADGTTSFDYNTLGQQWKITRPSIDYQLSSGSTGNTNPVTSLTFDALGNVASSTDADGSAASTPYSTTYTHDGLSRLTGMTRPAPSGSGSGLSTSYGYDVDSELTSVTDPLGNVTSIAYWHNGLKKSIRLPNPSDGTSSGGPLYQYDYTAAGQLYTVTDPFSNVTTYGYADNGQLSSVTLPSITVGGSSVTPVISFYHDVSGNQTAEKDAATSPNTTYYNFDHLNRLTEKREYVATGLDPSASPAYSTEIDAQALTSYLYDAAGNLTRTVDADSRVVGYAYNSLGQLTSENWFANTTSTTASNNTISYSYADAGELHTAVDYFGSGDSRNSAYAFTTNALGWVTAVDNNDSSTTGTAGVPRVVLNAKYDLNGNRTALNAQVNVGSGLTDDFQNLYTFDRLNRETSVIQQSKSGGYAVGYKKTTFVWYNDGRLQVLSDYKDSSTQAAQGSFTYDHVGRVTDITWSGEGGPYTIAEDEGFFDKFSWTYDYGSRAATMTSGIDANENLTYSYDNDSQLTSAVASYGGYGGGYGGYGAGYGGGTYGWDGNGDTTLSGWVTGKGNRLLKDGTYRYEYDAAGHMTKRTALTGGAYTEYGWDGRGRMISVTDKNSSNVIQQKIDLVYDAFNDLIARTVTPYSSGTALTPTVAHFVYDLASGGAGSPDLAGSGNAVLAFDGNQSLTDRYLWGPAVDEILADERLSPSGSNVMPSAAGTVYWALTDNENSVRDWITYGSLIDHIVYDSFGQVVNHSTSSIRFAFGHNGVFYDPSSGLEWHSQPGTGIPGRWFNPATRRWMSEDPTGLAAGPDQYAYCNNSPTNRIDPSGLDAPGFVMNFDGSWHNWATGQHHDVSPETAAANRAAVDSLVHQVVGRVENAIVSGCSGAATGFGAGAVAGGATGGVIAGPAGVAAGAGVGAGAGLVGGGVGGVISGLFTDPDAPIGEVAKGGALSGITAGVSGGLLGPVAGASGGVVSGSGTATLAPAIVASAAGKNAAIGAGAVTGATGALNANRNRSTDKGEYRDTGGHHVHAKAGFKYASEYDKNKGFCISQDYMKSRGLVA